MQNCQHARNLDSVQTLQTVLKPKRLLQRRLAPDLRSLPTTEKSSFQVNNFVSYKLIELLTTRFFELEKNLNRFPANTFSLKVSGTHLGQGDKLGIAKQCI